MTSAKVVELPKVPRRRRQEIAFLPAALEIIETPPSPIGRAVGVTIVTLFCTALVWASLGTVDIVATAPGKVIPSGRTKIVQPFETGVARAIHVHDGSAVKAGDVLIELDPTVSAADLEHARRDLIAAELDVARLRAALSTSPDPIEAFTPPAGAAAEIVEMQRHLLATQVAEQRAKVGEIDRQLTQKQAERNTISAMIGKIEATIPPLQERVDVRRYLYDKEIGSKLAYLSEFQDLVGLQHDLLVQKSRKQEIQAAIAALAQARFKAEAEYRHALLDDLSKAEQKAAGLAQDVIKAERRAQLQVLTAPIDGIVQQLAVHTVGGVVTPAQVLAVVVPRDSNLEIEAMVSNTDIGFVSAGQPAEIKVDTFNFTRYGLLHGKVSNVSRDAISKDAREDQSRGGQSTATDPRGQDLVYVARIVLDRTRMQIDDRSVPLLAGMAVTVEIKTGSRRIISYLLSPLLRYRHEVMRER